MWTDKYHDENLLEQSPLRHTNISINNVDEYEAQLMLRAARMALAIEDFRHHLRSLDKHGDFETEEASNIVEKLFSEYCDTVVAEVPDE